MGQTSLSQGGHPRELLADGTRANSVIRPTGAATSLSAGQS